VYFELVSSRGGSLVAKYFTRDPEKALEVADKLKAAELRPNIVKSGPNYVVYIATADLLKLVERDGAVRRAIALYLAEKAKNGTPRQREIAEKILKPYFFSQYLSALEASIAVNRLILNQNVEPGLYVELTTADLLN
jgi:type II secretory pathway component HofQ